MLRKITPSPHIPSTTPDKQSGFNLIEAAIVLGVIGLVLGGVWTAAAAASARNRIQEYSTFLLQVTNTARTHAALCRSSTCQIAPLLDPSLFPPGFRLSGDYITAPGMAFSFYITNGTLSVTVAFHNDAAASDLDMKTRPDVCVALSGTLLNVPITTVTAGTSSLWWTSTSWRPIDAWVYNTDRPKPGITQAMSHCQSTGLFGANGIML